MLTALRAEYVQWRRRRAATLAGDPIWRMTAYRLARFTADRSWQDLQALGTDRRTREVASQLCRAIGSVCANLAEGYSRSSGADRVRFYEYALGSARESREWYLQGEPVLGTTRTATGVELLARITKLLLTLIPQERRRLIRRSDRGQACPPENGRHEWSARAVGVATTQHVARSTQHAARVAWPTPPP